MIVSGNAMYYLARGKMLVVQHINLVTTTTTSILWTFFLDKCGSASFCLGS